MFDSEEIGLQRQRPSDEPTFGFFEPLEVNESSVVCLYSEGSSTEVYLEVINGLDHSQTLQFHGRIIMFGWCKFARVKRNRVFHTQVVGLAQHSPDPLS